MIRAKYLRSTGRRFHSRLSHFRVATVVYTGVPLSPTSIIWCRPIGGDAPRLGKVTAGLEESNVTAYGREFMASVTCGLIAEDPEDHLHTPSLVLIVFTFSNSAMMMMPFVQGVFVFSVVKYEPLVYMNYRYPAWGEGIGWLMALSSIVVIPAYAVYLFIVTPGNLRQVSSSSSSSSSRSRGSGTRLLQRKHFASSCFPLS